MTNIGLDREGLAWAAGFFDGEGNIYYSNKNKKRSPRLILQIAQVRIEPLEKFQSVFNRGTINGPYKPKSIKRQPYYAYRIEGFSNVQFVCAAMWKFLNEPKKEDYIKMLQQYLQFLEDPRCFYGHPLKQGKSNRLICSICQSAGAKIGSAKRWSKI